MIFIFYLFLSLHFKVVKIRTSIFRVVSSRKLDLIGKLGKHKYILVPTFQNHQ